MSARANPRIAFLSPLPPAATGIADYAVEVLALLADRYAIDLYCDQDRVDRERVPAGCALYPASYVAARHREEPYDLAIHQLGNGPDHGFVYEHLARLPGLLVLHDLVLHHSRARHFLASPEAQAYAASPWDAGLREAALERIRGYREEIAYCYPEQAGRLDEAQLGTVGTLLPYAYPLFRLPVEASRLTVVHNHFCAEAIRDEVPEAEVAVVPMPAAPLPANEEQRAALRRRYNLEPADFVVASFGLLTAEKRIATLARAVARAAARLDRLRLLLVGPVPDHARLTAQLEQAGVSGRTLIAGRVPFAELGAHMELADMAVHLRYPTARETSAALLRLLAQGRPVVMSDLENLAEIPETAVVRADVTDEEGEVTRAILRLAEQPDRRAALGRAAADFARREHAGTRCREAWVEVIERALTVPEPPHRDWPEHWRVPPESVRAES